MILVPDFTLVAGATIRHEPLASAAAGNAMECQRKDRSGDAESRTHGPARGSGTMVTQTKLADSEIVAPVNELVA